MKYLYKYPQAAYPYDLIVKTNRERNRTEKEYELIDTKVFDDDRYFDVFVDFAKSSPEDTLIQITAWNRGPQAATLHLLPQLWFRNTWSWRQASAKPTLAASGCNAKYASVAAHHPEIGERFFLCEGQPELLFTENETNSERLFHKSNPSPYVKDAFHNYVTAGNRAAVNPAQTGTKFAAHYSLNVPANGKQVVRLRFLDGASLDAIRPEPFGEAYENIFTLRENETDTFFDALMPPAAGEDERRVIRQAIAGMLWSKQYYYFDLDEWLREHGWLPGRPSSRNPLRNANWFHMINDDVISMPDKWEYPWYAVGPDLPHHRPELCRSLLRQRSAPLDDERGLSPPQRTNSRLRMEFRRRESSGPCLCRHLHLPDRQDSSRQGRLRIPPGRFPEAPAELLLVGQSQGSAGTQFV
jgi:hypothetical protein